MVLTIYPIKESGPRLLRISATNPRDPEPDNGLKIPTGRASAGIPILPVRGPANRTSKSSPPDARNIPTMTRMATRFGMIRTATLNPSLAPSTSDSYTLTPLAHPKSSSDAMSAGSTQKESIPRNKSPLGTVLNERMIWRQAAPRKKREKRGTLRKRQRGAATGVLDNVGFSAAVSNSSSVNWSELSWEAVASIFSCWPATLLSATNGGSVARKRGRRASNLAVVMATSVALALANQVGARMPAGSAEPLEARNPIIVVGMSVNPAVLMARKTIIASVAVPCY